MGGARHDGWSPPTLMLMRAGAVSSVSFRGTDMLHVQRIHIGSSAVAWDSSHF